MEYATTNYTTEGILIALGYPDTLTAARQQARVMLLGRLARFQAAVQQYEQTWDCTLEDMRQRYEASGREDSEVDNTYLDWQWYADALDTVRAQLSAIAAG